MLRCAAGNYEGTSEIWRLKAAHEAMRAASAVETKGTDNLLEDLERSDFENAVIHPALLEARHLLFDSLDAPPAQPGVQQLRACWPTKLLDRCQNEDLSPEQRDDLLAFIAGAALARIGLVKNCGEQMIENAAHLDSAVLEPRAEKRGLTHGDGRNGALVIASAGDHAWLEVQHPGANGELVTRPDDVIICTWSGERKVPLFREDAIYPASAYRRVITIISKELAEELPGYLDEFTENLRRLRRPNPVVEALDQETSKKASGIMQDFRGLSKTLRSLQEQKLPVSSMGGIYPFPPHPLKPSARAAARRGLRERQDPMNSHVVTRMARYLDIPVNEAALRTPRLVEIAREMAAEPRQRRMIAGKDDVFNDNQAPQEPRQILASLDGLGMDIPRLHTALWRFEDALQPADRKKPQEKQTLQENVRALRDWWRNANVPLEIHAHVFDILASDLIGDRDDFGQLTDMMAKLPVFMQSGAMLAHVLAHFEQGRYAAPLPEEAVAFKTNIRPQLEPSCEEAAQRQSLSERNRFRIKQLLDGACGVFL